MSHGHLCAREGREVAGVMCAPDAYEQMGERNLEAVGDFCHALEGHVAGARLNRSVVRAIHADKGGELQLTYACGMTKCPAAIAELEAEGAYVVIVIHCLNCCRARTLGQRTINNNAYNTTSLKPLQRQQKLTLVLVCEYWTLGEW